MVIAINIPKRLNTAFVFQGHQKLQLSCLLIMNKYKIKCMNTYVVKDRVQAYVSNIIQYF